MTNISDRIAILIKEKGISTRALEQAIGCSNGVISRCISKGTDISSLWVSKIIEIHNDINPTWLLTGKGDIYYNTSSTTQKKQTEENEKKLDELLELAGLSEFKTALPRELSGGMKQRVSIVRALSYDAPLLLMDEPFGALDALTRDHLNEELLKIWQKTKKTVIFVTHSIEEATFLSDRVLVMSARPGRVKEMVEIDLPRPRGEATRNDPKFTEYNKYLRGIIG